MKKIMFGLMAAVALLAATACGSKTETAQADEQPATVTVDQVLADAESLVGDTLDVEGVVSHLCRHGGRKAFLAGSASDALLRCEAFPLMGKPFPQEVVHKNVIVKGILREQRIDEPAIQEMEKAEAERVANIEKESGKEAAERAANADSGCETERTAQGQANAVTFADRMADYRAKIKARHEAEGKAYLSYYYLDAISYQELAD